MRSASSSSRSSASQASRQASPPLLDGTRKSNFGPLGRMTAKYPACGKKIAYKGRGRPRKYCETRRVCFFRPVCFADFWRSKRRSELALGDTIPLRARKTLRVVGVRDDDADSRLSYGPLEFVCGLANNDLKPGLRPSSPRRRRLASRRGQNAGPRLTKIIATARLSCFPRRCDVARNV